MDVAEEAMQVALSTRNDFENFRSEVRTSNHSLMEMMGKTMAAAAKAENAAVDSAAIVARIERKLLGEGEIRDVARREARETAEEITGRHHIPQPGGLPSDPIKKAVDQKWDSSIAGGVRLVAVAVIVALSLLVAGLVIRDCQHGNVPTQLH